MVKSREAFTEENQVQEEEAPVQTAADGDDNKENTKCDIDNKENVKPAASTCADIVKQGPASQRPSPLVMGGAEKRAVTGYSITEV